jgi:hypothetical protein
MSFMRNRTVGVATAILIAIVFATGPPFWFQYLPWVHARVEPTPGVIGFQGGCAPFQVFAQNRWLPYGAAIRTAPNVTSKQIGSRDPNQTFAVDGWVHSGAPYPTNSPPWNNDVWFHLADGAGWVSFAGIRAAPTAEDPTGLDPDGGPAVETLPRCQGSAQ